MLPNIAVTVESFFASSSGVGEHLGDVDAGGRLAFIFGEEGCDARPDDVALCKPQDCLVYRLDRRDIERHKIACIFEGCVEVVVAYIDKRRAGGDRQEVQFHLGDHRQRAFRTAKHRVEIEPAVLPDQVGEIIACHEAVELGENPLDVATVLRCDPREGAVDCADAVAPRLQRPQLLRAHRPGEEIRPIRQHHPQAEHMVACLAIKAGALAAGIGGNHAADRRPVRGR